MFNLFEVLCWQVTYHSSDTILLLNFVLQLPEASLHPLMEWPQRLRHLLTMNADALCQEWDLQQQHTALSAQSPSQLMVQAKVPHLFQREGKILWNISNNKSHCL